VKLLLGFGAGVALTVVGATGFVMWLLKDIYR
jgi:nitrate reductase NapE component